MIWLNFSSSNASTFFDISGNVSLPQPFQFSVGSNVVKANYGIMFTSGLNFITLYSQIFSFNIPTSDQIVSASLVTTQTLGDPDSIQFTLHHLSDPSASNNLIVASVPFSHSILTNVLPLPSGNYEITNTLFGVGAPVGTNVADYSFEFDVVPEPATLTLLTLGALGLAVVRRRQSPA